MNRNGGKRSRSEDGAAFVLEALAGALILFIAIALVYVNGPARVDAPNDLLDAQDFMETIQDRTTANGTDRFQPALEAALDGDPSELASLIVPVLPEGVGYRLHVGLGTGSAELLASHDPAGRTAVVGTIYTPLPWAVSGSSAMPDLTTLTALQPPASFPTPSEGWVTLARSDPGLLEIPGPWVYTDGTCTGCSYHAGGPEVLRVSLEVFELAG